MAAIAADGTAGKGAPLFGNPLLLDALSQSRLPRSQSAPPAPELHNVSPDPGTLPPIAHPHSLAAHAAASAATAGGRRLRLKCGSA